MQSRRSSSNRRRTAYARPGWHRSDLHEALCSRQELLNLRVPPCRGNARRRWATGAEIRQAAAEGLRHLTARLTARHATSYATPQTRASRSRTPASAMARRRTPSSWTQHRPSSGSWDRTSTFPAQTGCPTFELHQIISLATVHCSLPSSGIPGRSRTCMNLRLRRAACIRHTPGMSRGSSSNVFQLADWCCPKSASWKTCARQTSGRGGIEPSFAGCKPAVFQGGATHARNPLPGERRRWTPPLAADDSSGPGGTRTHVLLLKRQALSLSSSRAASFRAASFSVSGRSRTCTAVRVVYSHLGSPMPSRHVDPSSAPWVGVEPTIFALKARRPLRWSASRGQIRCLFAASRGKPRTRLRA